MVLMYERKKYKILKEMEEEEFICKNWPWIDAAAESLIMVIWKKKLKRSFALFFLSLPTFHASNRISQEHG